MFAIISTAGDRDVKDIGKKVSITGYVKDSQGNLVAGALVVLTNGEVKPDASNVVRQTQTDSTGTFQFNNLTSGSYGLAVWLDSNTLKIIKKKFNYLDSQIIFAGLDSASNVTPASITPAIVNNAVIGIVVNNGGANYSSVIPPIITFDGGYVGECTVENGAITGIRTIKQGDASSLAVDTQATILNNVLDAEQKSYPSVAGTSGSGGNGLGDALVQRLTDIDAAITNQVRSSTIQTAVDSPWRIVATADSQAVPAINWTHNFWAKANQVQNDIGDVIPNWYWRSGLVAYKVGEIIVHPDSADTLDEIFGVDGYYVGSTLLGGDNTYITINLVNTEIVSWSGVYSINEFGNPIVEIPEGENEGTWGAAIKYPTGLLFNSKQEALQAIAQGNAARNAVTNTQADYQTDEDPTLSQQLKDFVAGKYQDWQNFITNYLSNSVNNYDAERAIYDAIKIEGLNLLRSGTITESQYNIGKGFVGRDQFVAPLISSMLSNSFNNRDIAKVPTLLGILLWQAKDAIGGDAYDAMFDAYTQSQGALSNTAPTWITDRSFNVGGINKQYINGNWVNI